MGTENAQKSWEDYYQRKKSQRVSEASALWLQLKNTGVKNDTVLALDFVLFSSSQQSAKDLTKQLSENYEVHVIPNTAQDNWYINGTTRPYGITLSQEQHLSWVEFMADLAQSYACVFSTWSIEAPSLGKHFLSEDIQSDS